MPGDIKLACINILNIPCMQLTSERYGARLRLLRLVQRTHAVFAYDSWLAADSCLKYRTCPHLQHEWRTLLSENDVGRAWLVCLSTSAVYGWFVAPEGLGFVLKVVKGTVLVDLGEPNTFEKEKVGGPLNDMRFTVALQSGSEM